MHYYTVDYDYGEWRYLEEIGTWQCVSEAHLTTRDELGTIIKFKLYPYFRTDGGSIPKLLQKPFGVRSWYEDTHKLTSIAFAVHDMMYMGRFLAKDLADDLLRATLRDDGWGRVRAGIIHQCVDKFASRHWGTDEHGNGVFCRMDVNVT